MRKLRERLLLARAGAPAWTSMLRPRRVHVLLLSYATRTHVMEALTIGLDAALGL